MVAAIIVSGLSVIIAAFAVYRISQFEADSLVADCDNLDIYDDLEKRIEALEYGVSAHNKNVEVLAGRITELETNIIDLRNSVNSVTRQMQNTSTSLNNITAFVDKTRAMTQDNTRRLDNIQRGE